MARSSSGFVAGLTVAALAMVGFLAFQASGSVPDDLAGAKPSSSASPDASGSADSPGRKPEAAPLPDGSGQGKRVVYSLGKDRVWLVGEDGTVLRTYEVTPSAVDPLPGSYQVSSRTGTTTGSDGVAVRNVVRFAVRDNVVIGFSSASDGSTAPPDPAKRTGGVREAPEDSTAMWKFAEVGTAVVVVD